MRYGWCIEWTDRKKEKHSFASASIAEIDAKERELKARKLKVIGVYQCIF